jgi:putative intracellular protease/amidase
MKILIVTTSNDKFGPEGHPTGVWFEEFTEPYMEFLREGAEMVVASPKGGQMPIDPRTLPNEQQKIDWAPAIAAAANTCLLSTIHSKDFEAIFIPGGHGPMFDLPDDEVLHQLIREFYAAAKPIASVCHGPAGIVNVKGADGEYLVKGVTLTSYTYSEEVAAKLDTQVPFILEAKLREHGANFIARENRADHVERDGLFITGQNPWSSTSIARSLVATLQRRFQPMLNVAATETFPAQTVAEFLAPSFLENLAVSPAGKIAISSLEEGRVYFISAGIARPVDSVQTVAGLLWLDEDTLLAASTSSKSGLYKLRPHLKPELLVPIPTAKLLNGITHLDGTRYLVADSYQACIWVADIATGKAEKWLEHDLFAHASDPFHPVPQFPGINGIKRFGETLYASNTEQQKVIAINIDSDGKPGIVQVQQSLINLDDFAFDIEGNLYGATHIYNSVVRIAPDRTVTVLAGLAEGMAGSTAVAFGRSEADHTSIYITTNGGMSVPPEGGIQPGRVVRLDVGKSGYFPA